MSDIRVFFSKTGMLKYISHLDLQRAVARMLIRSKLPIAFSEGFNPHPKLSIVLPLSMYQEGENEALDIRLTEEVAPEEIVSRLSAVAFPGMVINKAVLLVKKSRPLKGVYVLSLKTEMSVDDILAAFEAPMNVEKRSKSGITVIDVASLAESVSALPTDIGVDLCLTLPAETNNYINPSYAAVFFGDSVKVVRCVRKEIVFS